MFCQKCRTPVTAHGSLADLSPAAFNLLTAESSSTKTSAAQLTHNPNYAASQRDLYDKASANAGAPLIKRTVPGAAPKYSSLLAGSAHGPADSFVMLTDSVFHAPTDTGYASSRSPKPTRTSNLSPSKVPKSEEAQSGKMRSARVFDIVSARSDVDYPVCIECTEMLMEGLQARLQQSTKERDAYQIFVKRVQSQIPTDEEKASAAQELEKVQTEHEAALVELERVEQQKMDVETEIAELEEESRKLAEEEDIFWRNRNEFAQKLEKYQNERESVNLQYDHDAKQLERLQRTNVYNDAFCIGHDGYFGTINGLRLGKLPSQQVEWTEINAAWGQTLLLLQTVADKLNFKFDGYRLKPMGSLSTIEKLEARPSNSSSSSTPSDLNPALATGTTTKDKDKDMKISKFDLFSSGTIPMGHLFAHRRFDSGMVAFLDCVKQLGEYVATMDERQGLPYSIVKDKIGDVSIRLTFNQDESWTKACKYALTCAKFLLAHASNYGQAGGRRQAGQT